MPNLRLAFRTLRRTPFVTAVAVLSLALGIGANAAIFSLVRELLLAPLPVPHPEQLVIFGGNTPTPGSHQTTLAGGDSKWIFSYAMFRDLEAQPGPFSGVAGHQDFNANLAARGNVVNARAEFVSGSYFGVLGVKPAIGRLLGRDDDRVIGANAVAVLSHDYWQSQLGGDPSVVGTTMTVNGQSMRIIGVTEAGFQGTTLGNRPALFVPITMRGVLDAGYTGYEQRRQYWIYVFARLRPGVTLEQAAARENVVYHRIINQVEAPLQRGVSEATLARFKAKSLDLFDGRRGSSDLHDETRTPLVLLFGITMLVLAIACANIANLLLARSANRATEMSVRLSLGASRTHLLAQLLAESVLLASLGGLTGLGVAWATLHGIVALLPQEVSSTLAFAVDPSAIGFAAALSMTTGLLFGLFPALHGTRSELVTALRSGSNKTTAARGAARFRTSLGTAQFALSMALLVSAGLFIRSLDNVGRVRLGIDVDELVTFRLAPVLNGYSGAESQALFARVAREVGAIPGVRGVTAARVPLIGGNNWDNDMNVQGFPHGPDTDTDAYFNAVGPDFFRATGQPLVAGRELTASDALGAPRVAVVNEAFVKKFRLGDGAVGRMVGEGDSLTHVIVGVVKNAKYSGVKQEDRPVYFLPYAQDTTVGSLSFYVRSTVPARTLLPEIRGTLARIDRTLPVTSLKTMPQQIRENVYLDRLITTLSAGFAALATLLAAVGLYGVLAYSVAQRTREIGVRMALGASARSIVAMVLRSVGTMAVVGAAVGIAAAYGIGRGAESLLFGVRGSDPLVVIAAVVALSLVSLAASSIPAWRAARVDPTRALRYE
ncbi:permease (plasmid) [Gemmatirosa kalamazoonensis]|uniref:Permease n=1 Tax=Gemmatirosa kalamazoonensis TaxID=861299 RepID=W0RQU5_9BACT|nr:ABC transporter permease [Gemmatirosa kalamazoonensis]AHG93359.1 permease [Gemmatirosa kalamazoonensis]